QVRLAQQFRDLRVEEGHAGGAGPQRVRRQVQPTLDDPGRELGVAVAAVVETGAGRGRDHDVRGLGAERLVEADPRELVPQVTRPYRVRQVGPLVDAGR